MDVWFPGRKGKDRTNSHVHQVKTAVKKTVENIAVVTYLCNLTGFATIAFIHSIDSESMARIAFSQFFTIRGMLKGSFDRRRQREQRSGAKDVRLPQDLVSLRQPGEP